MIGGELSAGLVRAAAGQVFPMFGVNNGELSPGRVQVRVAGLRFDANSKESSPCRVVIPLFEE
jgi:hypothetical protein